MMNYERKEIIGDCVLYLASCENILPDVQCDSILTDPPYGIGEAAGKNKSRGKIAIAKDYGDDEWDNKPCSPEIIQMMRECSSKQIIFGGNYFELPPTKCWLVWDKLNGNNDFADCELAWTNLDKAVRRISWRWAGMLRQGKDTERFHPTQKPIEVMEWCLGHLPNPETICDPFMGSGTTGVACVKKGLKFIGIEREPKYFDIACQRISDAYKQPDMLVNHADHIFEQDNLL